MVDIAVLVAAAIGDESAQKPRFAIDIIGIDADVVFAAFQRGVAFEPIGVVDLDEQDVVIG